MAEEGEMGEQPIRGEAAWIAERKATEQRNANTRKQAQDKQSASSRAAAERERRLDRLESAQLAALNQKLNARTSP